MWVCRYACMYICIYIHVKTAGLPEDLTQKRPGHGCPSLLARPGPLAEVVHAEGHTPVLQARHGSKKRTLPAATETPLSAPNA